MPSEPVSQAQVAELLRGQSRIESSINGLAKRMDVVAEASQERHTAVLKELHEHREDDAREFAELRGMVQVRSLWGGAGIAISAALSALGLKSGSGG